MTTRTEVVWEIRRPDGYVLFDSKDEAAIRKTLRTIHSYSPQMKLFKITKVIHETTEDVTPQQSDAK